MHKRNVNDFRAPQEAEFLSSNQRKAGCNMETDGRKWYPAAPPWEESACLNTKAFVS